VKVVSSGVVRWLACGAVGFGSLYAMTCFAARASYRLFIYPAPASRIEEASRPDDGEPLVLAAADGQTVHARWFPHPTARRLVVYFHGNGNVLEDQIPLGRDLVQRGLAVMLVEYRGYGASAGPKPSEEGIYADAEAALAEAKRRGFPAERVALWGTSLGTGVAAEMALRGRGARLVLVTPFTSLVDAARAHAPWWLPVSLIIPDRYDTLSKAPDIRVPTLVVHGDQDEVVPFELGRRVARSLPSAQFLPVAGAHHGDIYGLGGAALMDRIAKHCLA
jgi:pimeloyl-ACP methyl ester carboxylesterase